MRVAKGDLRGEFLFPRGRAKILEEADVFSWVNMDGCP